MIKYQRAVCWKIVQPRNSAAAGRRGKINQHFSRTAVGANNRNDRSWRIPNRQFDLRKIITAKRIGDGLVLSRQVRPPIVHVTAENKFARRIGTAYRFIVDNRQDRVTEAA